MNKISNIFSKKEKKKKKKEINKANHFDLTIHQEQKGPKITHKSVPTEHEDKH
jgi:hypothetical protein